MYPWPSNSITKVVVQIRITSKIIQAVHLLIERCRELKGFFLPGVLRLNASSISSKDRPCVSCMKAAQTIAVTMAQPPNKK